MAIPPLVAPPLDQGDSSDSRKASAKNRTLLVLGILIPVSLVLGITIYSVVSYLSDEKAQQAGYTEFRRAAEIHRFINSQFYLCQGISDYRTPPDRIYDIMGIPIDWWYDRHYFHPPSASTPVGSANGGNAERAPQESAPPPTGRQADNRNVEIEVSVFDSMVAALDYRLRVDRAQTAEQIHGLQRWATFFAVIIILLGLSVTVLNSFIATTIADKWKGQLWLAWFAVVLAACVTAATGYASQRNYSGQASTSEQRLTQLRSIHERLLNVVQYHYGPPICPLTDERRQEIEQVVLPIAGAQGASAPSDSSSVQVAYVAAVNAVSQLTREYEALFATQPVDQRGSGGKVEDRTPPGNQAPKPQPTVSTPSAGASPIKG